MNQAKLARLRFIDFLLDEYGTLNRSALEDFYGISTPQASIDIRDYAALAPANLLYDPSSKVYRKTGAFVRKFP